MGRPNITKRKGFSVFQFIGEVHKYDHLWNRKNKHFHSRELREETWMKVAQKLYADFEKIDKSEQKKLTTGFAKRWKNIRDSFFRVHKLRLRDDSIHPYIYEKELSFLLFDTKHENADSDYEPEASNVGDDSNVEELCRQLHEDMESADEMNHSYKMDDKKRVEELLIEQDAAGGSTSNSSPPKKRRAVSVAPPMQHQQQSLNAGNLNTSNITEFDNDTTTTTITSFAAITSDADQAFFDSIKPNVRALNASDKLDFQIEVLKLLKQFAKK